MIQALTWQSVEFNDCGNCIFFKADMPQNASNLGIANYEIDIVPQLSEYSLYLMYNDGSYQLIAQYLDFASASKTANLHYQNIVKTKPPTPAN